MYRENCIVSTFDEDPNIKLFGKQKNVCAMPIEFKIAFQNNYRYHSVYQCLVEDRITRSRKELLKG